MKKKAQLQVPGVVAEFYAYVVWVLIILLFFLLFQMQGCESRQESTVQANIPETDANMILLNYLRTPVEDDIVADLIAAKDLTALEATKKYLDSIYGQEEMSWYIEVKLPQENFMIKGTRYDSMYGGRLLTNALLPSQDKKLIEVNLYRQLKSAEYLPIG